MQLFDQWSPFLKLRSGQSADSLSVLQMMAREEANFAAGIGAEDRTRVTTAELTNNAGNAAYAYLEMFTDQVGYRSAELPEVYGGDWAADSVQFETTNKLLQPVGAVPWHVALNMTLAVQHRVV